MRIRHQAALAGAWLLALGLALWALVRGHTVDILNPAGLIGRQELGLMQTAVLLMLIVVVPVFVITGLIVWRYRAGRQARYTPDWDHSVALELVWWAIPLAIIAILAVIAWQSAHRLDPFKPLASQTKPLTVQVVALQWKWLFIYPEQGVASVNDLELPAGTPINFQITADAPMNSFWIPQLGGQIYAMPGMVTQLHLVADRPGRYNGYSANISGTGFAAMHFTATATSQADFTAWVTKLKQTAKPLSFAAYGRLAQPATASRPSYYAGVEHSLYNDLVMKYMMPMPALPDGTGVDSPNSQSPLGNLRGLEF